MSYHKHPETNGYYYIDGLGVWVGEFTEDDIKERKDIKYMEYYRDKTGLTHINAAINHNNFNEPVLRYWVCYPDDVIEFRNEPNDKLFKEIQKDRKEFFNGKQ